MCGWDWVLMMVFLNSPQLARPRARPSLLQDLKRGGGRERGGGTGFLWVVGVNGQNYYIMMESNHWGKYHLKTKEGASAAASSQAFFFFKKKRKCTILIFLSFLLSFWTYWSVRHKVYGFALKDNYALYLHKIMHMSSRVWSWAQAALVIFLDVDVLSVYL